MLLIIFDGNFDIPDGCMFQISKASKKTEEDSEDESNKTSSNQGEEDEAKLSLLACERSKPRENARSRGEAARGRGSLINFHFHPGNPGTPQSMKIVTANVRQIRKVTTACQVSLDSRGRVELFIYKSLSQQH